MQIDASVSVQPLTPTKSKDEKRLTSADLVCKERMPTPDAISCPSSPEVFHIPVEYPWKRTYCGSELIYDPDMSDAEIIIPEQTLDPAAAVVPESREGFVTPKTDDEDTGVVKAVWGTMEANAEENPREQSVLYSPTAPVVEENKVKRTISYSPEVGRTGSDSPKIGRTGSDSPKIGRTGSDSPKDARTVSVVSGETFTMNVVVKLEPFSPPRAKTGVREDSEPAQEAPFKRVRFESEPPEGKASVA